MHVMPKLTNVQIVHLVEHTRNFLLPIFSVVNVKMENMGIMAYDGHFVRMVRVFLHPQFTSKRVSACKWKMFVSKIEV